MLRIKIPQIMGDFFIHPIGQYEYFIFTDSSCP